MLRIFWLTTALIFIQLLFVVLHYSVTGMAQVEQAALTGHTSLLIKPFCLFLLGQILLYAAFMYFIWLTARSINSLFGIQHRRHNRVVNIVFISVSSALLILHLYYVPHSFFTKLIFSSFMAAAPSEATLSLLADGALCLLAVYAATIAAQMVIDLKNRMHVLRHAATFIVAIMACVLFTTPTPLQHRTVAAHANRAQPNIFLIGFDALRPDYLSYFNQHTPSTPAFDDFLHSSTVFTEAYTPLARTFPAWTTIFTGSYPLHHLAREDNANIQSVQLTETLPKTLAAHGYQTIFAAEDNRFSNIGSEFGIQELVGTNGNITDYLMSVLNDFPLSNLMVPTRFGKIFFPHNYGNHGAAATYASDNFIEMIHTNLQNQSDKPIMLAVHFNITAFPFYYFNDHQPYSASTAQLYQHAVTAGDQVFYQFMMELSAHGLLQHAVVVLLSDHGITLAQQGDRITTLKHYQGDALTIPLKRTKYAGIITSLNNTTDSSHSPFSKDIYGIDTSFGYGGDVLSLKQHRSLLAIHLYGEPAATTRAVNKPVLLNDIAPTLFDLLHLPPMKTVDGVSLAATLFSSQAALAARPVFLESGFSIPEIESDGIVLDNVVSHYANLFEINADTGLVYMKADAAKLINTQKQRAIIANNWMLAYYPASRRYHTIVNERTHNITYQPYIAPSYAVLVNLASGAWTSDMNNSLAKQAPLNKLNAALTAFYGDEMNYYHRSLHSTKNTVRAEELAEQASRSTS